MTRIRVALTVAALAITLLLISALPATGVPIAGNPQFIEILDTVNCHQFTADVNGDASIGLVLNTGQADSGNQLLVQQRYRAHCNAAAWLNAGGLATTAHMPVNAGAPEEMSFSAAADTNVCGITSSGTSVCTFCPITTRRRDGYAP